MEDSSGSFGLTGEFGWEKKTGMPLKIVKPRIGERTNVTARQRTWWILAAAILLVVAAPSSGRAEGNIALDRYAIVADPGQASFVQYAVEELGGFVKGVTGNAPVAANDRATTIAVGPQIAQRILGDAFAAQKLGEEGYLLKTVSRGDATWIVAAGATAHGTKNAVAALLKAIHVEGNSALISAPLDRVGKPAYAKRGMHFNGWAFNSPYSFRNWREADWKRYIDILSYQGVNLLYLWPFIEIMPVPLSPEDQAYLDECHRIVDYAQKKHGMEVWLMQCTNRVAKDRCGVADPRLRPYWRPSQEDLNPGKPEDFQAILKSREAMYRMLDNADGVCNIDSDPGFCPESNFDDYVKVLRACRELLDRINLHGKEAKLVNWMLWGWGRKEQISMEGLVAHQRQALRSLKQGLPDSLWLISGQFPEYLPMCREEGFGERTILLPYGTIEFEPAYPHSNVQIDAIRGMFNGPDAHSPGLPGFMGNMQTPLLQFPNMFFFTSVLSDFDYRNRSEKDVLLDLAGLLYPNHRRLLADAYLALKNPNPKQVTLQADQLDGILREDALGPLGLFARKLFPDSRFAATSLLLQLRLRAAREELVLGAKASLSRADCEKLIADYISAYLAWDTAHGWHGLWGWSQYPLGGFPSEPRYAALTAALAKCLGSKPEVEACFQHVAQAVSAKFEQKIVQEGCIAPLKQAVLAAMPAAKAR